MLEPKATVFVVDDDPVEAMHIERICNRAMFTVRSFNDANEFLLVAQKMSPSEHGCVVLDVRMPKIDGLETLHRLVQIGCHLPIVFFTGMSDIGSCRDALKSGAFDFITKDSPSRVILNAIRNAIDSNLMALNSPQSSAAYAGRLALLTPKELEVMEALSLGAKLKDIAEKMDILPQTASKHRSRIFEKLGVLNEVQLVRLMHGLDMR